MGKHHRCYTSQVKFSTTAIIVKENDFLFILKSKIYCSWKPSFCWRKQPEEILLGFIRFFLIMSPSGAYKELGYIFNSPFLHIEQTNPLNS